MKARVTLSICGIHQWTEEREIGDDSVLGLLASGNLSRALVGIDEMKSEIEGATVSCEIGEEGE